MIVIKNLIVGVLIITINLIALIFKKDKLLFVTGLLSVLLLLILKFVI